MNTLVVSSKLLFALIVVLSICNDAHAYIDPGSGSILTQLLFAAVASLLFYFRSIIKWLVAIYNRLFNEK